MDKTMSFGYDGDGGLGDRLLAAVLRGEKTATSSLAVEYLSGEALPRVGDRLTLTDHAGRPHGVVETTRVTITPLDRVGDDVAWAEGEGFADAREWRRDHIAFWGHLAQVIRAEAGDPDWRLREAEPVVVHWFRLLTTETAKSAGRIAVVTGANQGLGFALAEGLARRMSADDIVYLTGRDSERVRESAARILAHTAMIDTHSLDVRDEAAVAAFADELRRRHGGVDIVFSNAAARLIPDTPWADLIEAFVDTNNLGTTRILRAFSPILRPGGRLLVVASDFGTLNNLPESLHDRFDTDTMTLDDVDAAMLAWRDAVLDGTASAEGWPEWINIPSKVGQVAAARVLARDRRTADLARGTLVAAVCPGLIDTAASRPWFNDMSGAQTPEQAAAELLPLALESVRAETYGELVQFGRVRPWL